MRLKPCPFCGGNAKFYTKSTTEKGFTKGWGFGIFCTKCDVRTAKDNYKLELHLNEYGDLETVTDERLLAVTTWNRRATNEAD